MYSTIIRLLGSYFILLETAPKTQNISKFTKEQEIFAKWTIDATSIKKNWLGRKNVSEHHLWHRRILRFLILNNWHPHFLTQSLQGLS